MRNIHTIAFDKPLLEEVADYLAENYVRKGKDLSRVAVLFGGKRPRLFLAKFLAERIGKDFYPPRFFTIDEFVTDILRRDRAFSVLPELDACYLIYTLAQTYTPEILKSRESFERFLPWAREILKFIDQLDLECVEDQALLNVEHHAEIGYDVPENINVLLKSILTLKQAFHRAMEKEGVWTRGYQYRKAGDHIADCDLGDFDEIIFCNFFYFHKSEERVVSRLHAQGKAVFFFQGDERKWPVFRRLARRMNIKIKEPDFHIKPFDLKLYAGKDLHAQVGLVKHILKNVDDFNRTVVVLPQAQSLVPLLSQSAGLIRDFNVSLGYPLKRSGLYSLLDALFRLQIGRKEGKFYTKDYLKVLTHPFIKNLTATRDESVTRILVHKIEEMLQGKEASSLTGEIFVSLEDLERNQDFFGLSRDVLAGESAVSGEDLRAVLKMIHDVFIRTFGEILCFADFTRCLTEMLGVLIDKSRFTGFPLNMNIAERMLALCGEWENARFAKEKLSMNQIYKIFDAQISHEMTAFHGSPLKGLQVLGLFETRSLNFDHVIVLDANESSLPALSVNDPLIPREIMVSLGLDRLELEEEIQRYQFMRLISGARKVHLIYQDSKDKERSRFIEELVWNQEQEQQALRVITPLQGSYMAELKTEARRVKKTKAMIEFLKGRTFSASSINTYLRNPMEFYYNYVLGLREEENLLDDPQAHQVGSFLHEVLHESFKPFVNKTPKLDGVFEKRVNELFEEKFARVFDKGKGSDSFLLKSVMRERLQRFLDYERESANRQGLSVLFLEEKFRETISLPCGNFRFQYIVDRIDKLKDGSLLLIDYKTGALDQMPRNIHALKDSVYTRAELKEIIHSFQIPLYVHYLLKAYPDQNINAALYNLRMLKMDVFYTEKIGLSLPEIDRIFLDALNFVMSEILSPDVDFIDDPAA